MLIHPPKKFLIATYFGEEIGNWELEIGNWKFDFMGNGGILASFCGLISKTRLT
jgi:hypothetical protein